MNETEQMAAEIAEEVHPIVKMLRRKTRDDYPRPNITVSEYLEDKKKECPEYTRAMAYTDLMEAQGKGKLDSIKVKIGTRNQRIWWEISTPPSR